jgi:hypothetical protein
MSALGEKRTLGSRIGYRMFVQGLGKRDRSTRDFLPVIGVEIVEHPRADEPAKQPEKHYNADNEPHRGLCLAGLTHHFLIGLIFDPSRPIPAIRPLWPNGKAITSFLSVVVVLLMALPWSITTTLGPEPIDHPSCLLK